MKLSTWIRAQLIILKVALQAGQTPAQVRQDMQAAIDVAWTDPPAAFAARQQLLFPAGKPTVEEFMATLSGQI